MNLQQISAPQLATHGRPRTCRACEGATRGHRIINGRRVCPSREEMIQILYQMWSEGMHGFAESTARKLGESLNIPLRGLMERVTVERRLLPGGGLEDEAAADLPPVGMWDPENVRRLRPDARLSVVNFLDDQSGAPTLLNDSEHMTIRTGSAYEYWNRRGAVGANNGIADLRDHSPFTVSTSTSSDSLGDVPSERSSGVGSRFLNILRSLRSNISTVTIPVHPLDIAVVQEEVASGGFRSMVIEPATVYDLPLVIIGRSHPGLTQYVDAVKAHAKREILKSVILSNVLSVLASMVFVWYHLL